MFRTDGAESVQIGCSSRVDFIFFLEKINYMFPKAHGVAYLREAIAMMYYKLKYNKEYNEVILENEY